MVLCEAWQCFDEVKRGMNGTKGIQQLVEPDKFRREVPIESIDGARRIFEKFIPAKVKPQRNSETETTALFYIIIVFNFFYACRKCFFKNPNDHS